MDLHLHPSSDQHGRGEEVNKIFGIVFLVLALRACIDKQVDQLIFNDYSATAQKERRCVNAHRKLEHRFAARSAAMTGMTNEEAKITKETICLIHTN